MSVSFNPQGGIPNTLYCKDCNAIVGALSETSRDQDPFAPLMQTACRTLANYKTNLWNIQREVIRAKVTNLKREDELSKFMDLNDEAVIKLAQQIDEVCRQSVKPHQLNLWVVEQKKLVADCEQLLLTCKKIANDPLTNHPQRKMQWHLHGAIEAVTQLRDGLLYCATSFGLVGDSIFFSLHQID